MVGSMHREQNGINRIIWTGSETPGEGKEPREGRMHKHCL